VFDLTDDPKSIAIIERWTGRRSDRGGLPRVAALRKPRKADGAPLIEGAPCPAFQTRGACGQRSGSRALVVEDELRRLAVSIRARRTGVHMWLWTAT